MSSFVFIDSRVADIERLLAGLAADVQVVILDPSRDGITQIAAALTSITNLDWMWVASAPFLSRLGAKKMIQRQCGSRLCLAGFDPEYSKPGGEKRMQERNRLLPARSRPLAGNAPE